MAVEALVGDLTPIEIPLDQIMLDPNNPRFVLQDWVYVSDQELASDAIQDEVRVRLVRAFDVDKLRMNMEVNGYLPIDRVIVRSIGADKYVVLEGNRRICAAKMISSVSMDGSAVSDEVLASLKRIPCLEYTGGDSRAAWILQGLRHITGIVDWSSYNKAKLLVEQMEEESLTLSEAGKRFGLTPHGAGQWVRGYYAFKQARENSDFISEVDERSYPYFQELFSRSTSPVRDWLRWNDRDRQFEDALNFNEFVSWLYPREDNDGVALGKGDWEQRVIRTQDDIRQIAYLLKEDKQAFEEFRRGLDVEKAYSLALSKKYELEARESYDPVGAVFGAIQACIKAIDNVPYKILRDEPQRLSEATEQLGTAVEGLKKALSRTIA